MTSCPDCPDLIGDRMPEGWTPRERCCRDEHIDRRLAGSFEAWAGVEAARQAADLAAQRNARRASRRARFMQTSGMTVTEAADALTKDNPQ
jgi:hypothetical protein